MKNIVAFRSAEGNYFDISKKGERYYLKNKYTEIPNEFSHYREEDVKKLFDDLCEIIPECETACLPGGHPNSCMYVFFDDGTAQLLREKETAGKNICAFTSRVAEYSEFFYGSFLIGWSEQITLEHLRQVCRTKSEDYSYFLKAIRDFIEDDYVDITEKITPDGGIEFHESLYCIDHGTRFTISPNGEIGKTGELLFVEVMKEQNVVIKNLPTHL